MDDRPERYRPRKSPEELTEEYCQQIQAVLGMFRELSDPPDPHSLTIADAAARDLVSSTAFTNSFMRLTVRIPEGTRAITSNYNEIHQDDVHEFTVSELRAVFIDKVDFYSYASHEWLTVFGHDISIEPANPASGI